MATNETTFKPEVTYSFLSASDSTFKAIVADIVAGTVDNPFFPNSQPKALNVKNHYLEYAPTVVDKEKQNSETAAIRVVKRGLLEKALRELLPAIQYEANGSLPALLSTNIPLSRNPERPDMAYAPLQLSLFLFGNPQQLFVQCEKQWNAQLYHAQISRDKENWIWTSSDVRSAVGFSNLPVGEKLYVQMRVKNSLNLGEWSIAVPFYIPEPGVKIPEFKRPRGVR